VLLEGEPRLENRGRRQLCVDPGDALVGAVVEAPVDADRAVDAMHHSRAPGGEATETREVEVERVEQARGRALRDALLLDVEAAGFQLADEGAEELMPATRGRRCELVEQRQVGSALPCAQPVALEGEPPVDGASRPARGAHDAPRLHGDHANVAPARAASPAGRPTRPTSRSPRA